MKSKKEAAEFLGVSERSVERYVKRFGIPTHNIESDTSDGKRRIVAHYAEEDLQRVKDAIEEKTQLPPMPGAQADALALRPSDASPVVAMLAEALRVAFPSGAAQLPAAPVDGKIIVPVADKLTLPLKEAAALAGLSPDYLRARIREGKLKAELRGRGWNVKRTDLDAFIKDL